MRRYWLHEKWVQQECPIEAAPSEDDAIGWYGWLMEQEPEAYTLFRIALGEYLCETQGFGAMLSDVKRLFSDCDRMYPQEMMHFWSHYEDPPLEFNAQWRNIWPISTRMAFEPTDLFWYQEKYEVDLFLVVLAQLRSIRLGSGWDEYLCNLRDSRGKLKKGVAVDFVLGGLGGYAGLHRDLEIAYDPRLRNTIGHNMYTVVDNTLKSLDGEIEVSVLEFVDACLALQNVQNSILWMLSRKQIDLRPLVGCGVVTTMLLGDGDRVPVSLQLAPFFEIDSEAAWLDQVCVAWDDGDDTFVLQLPHTSGYGAAISQPLAADLLTACGTRVAWSLLPVMPCIHHGHKSIETPWGPVCVQGGAVVKEVELI